LNIAGACCGPDEVDGCVNDVQVRYCSATSEWSKDVTCENVCGENECFLKK